MFVQSDDIIARVDLEEWLPRVEKMKSDNPELWEGATTYKFHQVDVCNNTAWAKLSVWKNNKYFSTDLMLLYKERDQWKIVAKTFTIEEI
jgi:hypothetical protein